MSNTMSFTGCQPPERGRREGAGGQLPGDAPLLLPGRGHHLVWRTPPHRDGGGEGFLFPLLVLDDKRSIEPRILFKGAQPTIQTYPDPQQRPGAGRRPECCPPAGPDSHKAYPDAAEIGSQTGICGFQTRISCLAPDFSLSATSDR